MAEIIDMKIMFKYSAMKMKVNDVAAYSVLNPETNSLSPSAKSKGVRFVSANRVVNQMNDRIGQMRSIVEVFVMIIWRLNEVKSSRMEMRIRVILTS